LHARADARGARAQGDVYPSFFSGASFDV